MYTYTPYVPDTDHAKEINDAWREEIERLNAGRDEVKAHPSALAYAMLESDEQEIMYQALIAVVLKVEGWEGVAEQTLAAMGESPIQDIADALNAVENELTQETMEQELMDALVAGKELTEEQTAFAKQLIETAVEFDAATVDGYEDGMMPGPAEYVEFGEVHPDEGHFLEHQTDV